MRYDWIKALTLFRRFDGRVLGERFLLTSTVGQENRTSCFDEATVKLRVRRLSLTTVSIGFEGVSTGFGVVTSAAGPSDRRVRLWRVLRLRESQPE